MNILELLKEKYYHAFKNKRIKTVKRKQFNMVVSQDIIFTVQYLAIILHVPYYVLIEHLLQLGVDCLLEEFNNAKTREN